MATRPTRIKYEKQLFSFPLSQPCFFSSQDRTLCSAPSPLQRRLVQCSCRPVSLPILYKVVSSSTNYHKFSFFPRTIKEWNSLPQSMVESPYWVSYKARLANHFRNREMSFLFYFILFYSNFNVLWKP